MCGITGFLGSFDQSLLTSMTNAIAHRGPDDEGYYLDKAHGIGLGHRRLSIIDLSPTGHQPMASDNGQVHLAYNGELYNFQALRAQLVDQGYSFRGTSDTEVLLNLYLRDGTDMLSKLDGIFAFALYDKSTKKLLIARDGIGVKPLYYSQCDAGFLFSSELKSLTCYAGLDRTINPQAVHHHMTYLWSPAPATMFNAVSKLEPGHAMLVSASGIEREWSFYDLPCGQVSSQKSISDSIEEVRQALKEAVQRQLVSDVPVGAFLSGGLDSSAIVALAKEQLPAPMECFTIATGPEQTRGFEGFADDLGYARQVAGHLGVNLHEVTAGPEMIDHLESMIYQLDEPTADPAPLNVQLISLKARELGIKVLLSGAGGDDIFSGYRRHLALSAERYWDWLPVAARRGLKSASQLLPASSATGRRLRKAFAYADRTPDERLCGYFHWLEPDWQQAIYGEQMRGAVAGSGFSQPLMAALQGLDPSASRLAKMLYLDSKYFLTDHNLNYTDKMSMAHGIEVRVPLLDRSLIDVAAALPDELKQRGRTGKWIFRQAMAPYLPPAVLNRPKTGFGAPLRYWLNHQLKPITDELLSSPILESRGLFDPEGVRRLRQADASGQVDATYPLFSMMVIELWCRRFADR